MQSDKGPIALPASLFTKTSAVKRPSCDDLLQAGITDLMKTTAARLRGQPCKTHYGETTQHLREQLKRRKDFFGRSFRVQPTVKSPPVLRVDVGACCTENFFIAQWTGRREGGTGDQVSFAVMQPQGPMLPGQLAS